MFSKKSKSIISHNNEKEGKSANFFSRNNNTTTIDKSLSENGYKANKGQLKDIRIDAKCQNNKFSTRKLFSKICRKMNISFTSKSSSAPLFAGQRGFEELPVSAPKTQQLHNTVPELHKNQLQRLNYGIFNTRRTVDHNHGHAIPFTEYPDDNFNELHDWKTTLLNELDATQHKYNKIKTSRSYGQLFNNKDSNELVMNTLQPSGMENNRKANRHFSAVIDEKLGAISKEAMIDDWLHCSILLPSARQTEITACLEQYNKHTDNNLICKMIPIPQQKTEKPSSLLSAQFKREGKKKHDHIKERLDIAAARRNEIKYNRLREQMDTAFFETIHMLRENDDTINNLQVFNQQNIDHLLAIDKIEAARRKTYLPNETAAFSVSNDYNASSTRN